MSVCPSCGKDNQARYLFCLSCGAELPANRPGAAGPNAATVMADAPDLSRVSTANNPAVGRKRSEQMCPRCNVTVAADYKFCPTCGSSVVDGSPRTGGGAPPAAAGVDGEDDVNEVSDRVGGKLVVVRPDGSEGGSVALQPGENTIGRRSGALFASDGYLSPMHAEFVLNAAGLVVRDAGSLNGVYVKLTSEEELEDGDLFRLGQEVLRFDSIQPPQPLDDGTDVLGSPNPGYWGRLGVVVGKDQVGLAWPLTGDAVTIGRERGEITFPEDGYVSGAHARLTNRNGRFFLADLNSSNGTFLRVRGERALPSGSLVLMGQQLFRVTY